MLVAMTHAHDPKSAPVARERADGAHRPRPAERDPGAKPEIPPPETAKESPMEAPPDSEQMQG